MSGEQVRARRARLGLVLVGVLLLGCPPGAFARKVLNPTDQLTARATAVALDIRKGFGHEQHSSLAGISAQIFSGATVAADGSLAIPAGNLAYPALKLPDFSGTYTGCATCVTVDYRLTNVSLTVVPAGAVTGQLNPLTGELTSDWRVYFRVRYHLDVSYAGLLRGQYEPRDCTIGTPLSPVDIVLASGRTAPPSGTPNGPVSGVPYDDSTGTVGLVDNTFALPQSSGDCSPALGLFTFSLDNYLGLPSPSGYNALNVSLALRPVIRRAIIAKIAASIPQGLSVRFDASGSQAAAGVARYEFDFNGDGVIDQSGSSPIGHFTFANAGVYHARVTVVDHDGDSDTATTTVVVGAATPVSVTAGGRVKMLRRHGSVVIVTGQFVFCPRGQVACGVAVTVTTRAGPGRAGRRAQAGFTKAITIASARLRIPAGSRRVISFRLTRTGAALLRRRQILPITAIAIGTHGAAKPVRIVMILTLTEPSGAGQPPSGGSSVHPTHHRHHRHARRHR